MICSLARNVLANARRTLTQGEEEVWTFLIRTPELVEAGVRNELRLRLSSSVDVRKGTIPLGGGTMTVAPDLVFGSIDAIGDVKYKLATARWLRSDLCEVVAFATAARTARACVVGFRHTTDPHPPVVAFGDTEARYFSVDLRPRSRSGRRGRWSRPTSLPIGSASRRNLQRHPTGPPVRSGADERLDRHRVTPSRGQWSRWPRRRRNRQRRMICVVAADRVSGSDLGTGRLVGDRRERHDAHHRGRG